MPELGSVAERLARNTFDLDQTSHIEIDQAVARATRAGPLLVRICPAGVYSEAVDGTVVAQYAACLECGTCLALAPAGSLTWHYPAGGFGITFREG